ncbi:MAG: YifB family Mg chelatase-like AAA ATPase [Candidatus Omnitrophica bacterium]|nr:YifB family Mg chelatase-like AAA ATPase [Candidatus Omnitrophota bacterium]
MGIEAYPLEIEIDISSGLPAVNLIGLPCPAIKESKNRLKPAIKNSGFSWPAERITINLTPSDIKKEGTSFDLAIALGILSACGKLDRERLEEYVILGEVSLDGAIRPVKGILPIVMLMRKLKKKKIILPEGNAREAGLIADIDIYPVKTLKAAALFINDPDLMAPFKTELKEVFMNRRAAEIDFSDVKGQQCAKRALEVAAAGGHNVLMIGPPGNGKSMLAKRITTIIPDMSLDEALEITRVHSVAGIAPLDEGLVTQRPFRQVHHTVSAPALVGGGTLLKPGEITLSHHGVLFMDELPEFHRDCLEALRQPLEDGYIRISRMSGSMVFPSSFMLVAAMNPCPCGYYSDPQRACRCNPNKIQSYMNKVSGPLLDRIDIHINIPSIKYQELSGSNSGESSLAIRARVEKARAMQRERFKEESIFYNAQMSSRLIRKYCLLDQGAVELLKMAMSELGFSARAYDKILKAARTIADLAGSEDILEEHISEAIQYRSLDRSFIA